MARWCLFFLLLLSAAQASAHPGTLDAYGCHSNKALYGTTAWRECHADLLNGQVFTSSTAEYKAYIAAQKLQLSQLQASLQQAQSELSTVKIQLETATQQIATLTAQLNVSFRLAMAWGANTEPDLAGYKLYCGTVSGQYTITRTITPPVSIFILADVPPAKYFCRVSAFDKSGNESAKSNEVSNAFP